jgi:sulfite exporter TauE/SafE
MEIIAALSIGFLGSFHCIGMCGPIALALPLPKSSNIIFILGRIVYNLGRVISYAIMGLVFGWLGQKISLWGFQQILSILLGIAIVFFIFLPAKTKDAILSYTPIQKIISPLKASIGKLFRQKSLPSFLLIGVLNGFLPCGFVYMGLAGAIAAANPVMGMLVMAFFGLGTFPAMFTVAVFGKFINFGFRQKLRKLTPVFAILFALIFIFRGLNLGIPYLSPKMGNHNHMQVMGK